MSQMDGILHRLEALEQWRTSVTGGEVTGGEVTEVTPASAPAVADTDVNEDESTRSTKPAAKTSSSTR